MKHTDENITITLNSTVHNTYMIIIYDQDNILAARPEQDLRTAYNLYIGFITDEMERFINNHQ